MAGTFDRRAFANPLHGPRPRRPAPYLPAIGWRDESPARPDGRSPAASAASRLARRSSNPRLPSQEVRVLHVTDIWQRWPWSSSPLHPPLPCRSDREHRRPTDYGTEVEGAVLGHARAGILNSSSPATTTRGPPCAPWNRSRTCACRMGRGHQHGIRFAGWPDPVSRRGLRPRDPPPPIWTLERGSARAAGLPNANVLMVHNHRVAEPEGVAPVVLFGRLTAVRRNWKNGVVNAGTTGCRRHTSMRGGVPIRR